MAMARDGRVERSGGAQGAGAESNQRSDPRAFDAEMIVNAEAVLRLSDDAEV
jgi:hypothetical protein